MAEGYKVRLVRCPRCGSLLPEADYSIYECGGCGVVLRAKKKENESGGSLEKPGKEETNREGFEKSENWIGEGRGVIGYASETESESCRLNHERRKKRAAKQKTVNLAGTDSSTMEDKKVSVTDARRILKEQNVSYQSSQKGGGYVDKNRQNPKHQFDDRGDDDTQINGRELVDSNREKDNRETYPSQIKGLARSWRSRSSRGKWGLDGGGSRVLHGKSRSADKQIKMQNFAYPDEGPSNHHPGLHGYSHQKKSYDQLDRPKKVAHLEKQRSELLWKLDELKEQLGGRSNPMAEKLRARILADNIRAPHSHYDSITHNATLRPLATAKHLHTPSYAEQHIHGPVLYRHRHHRNMQNLSAVQKSVLPPRIPAYEDPFQPKTCQHCQQPPSHDCFSTQFMYSDQECLTPYPYRTMSHKPVCSCLHRNRGNSLASLRAPPIVPDCRRFSQHQVNHRANPVSFRLSKSSPQTSFPTLHFRDQQPNIRWSSNIDSNVDYFRQSHARRDVGHHGKRRLCHPVAGGAPLLICYNCFQLLTLPGDLNLRHKNWQKLQCGACSEVLSLVIENKKLIISLQEEKKKIDGSDDFSQKVSKEVDLNASDYSDTDGTESRVINESRDFGSADIKDNVLPETQEYLNADTSEDCSEVSKEEKGSRTIKGIESFLMGVIKKSFKDLSISNDSKDNKAPNVFVNGQPIPRHAVIKAEKLTGAISPGNYWYDSKAGFWGVIGQPCLGIIPPFIEEFSYPMPASCAAGNTSVFVNGRELHQNDLDLLASKGLPTTKGKFYIIEFSGRVLDKDSGEEVANLGKLAPTNISSVTDLCAYLNRVESLNRGFGMLVPEEIR